MSFRTKAAAYFSSLMGEGPHTSLDKLVLHILDGGAVVYDHCVRAKYRPYKENKDKSTHLPARVISLGNITVGGTGKTPMACLLARYLREKGLRVALLNRGYRSRMEKKTAVMSDGKHILLTQDEGGDEAYLLARILPGIPVIVGRDREASGRLAIERFHTQILILDDAFQHWQLARDLDIVLIDATNPFGNGKLLPRGILREPLEHLDRAGLFVITKTDGKTPEDLAVIRQTLHQYNSKAPVATAVQKVKWCVPYQLWLADCRTEYSSYISGNGQKAVTVSALGNPVAFEVTARQFGYNVADTIRFDDHHQYDDDDMKKMKALAIQQNAVIVTTEKDAVKISLEIVEKYNVPLYVLGIETEITDGWFAIQSRLELLLGG